MPKFIIKLDREGCIGGAACEGTIPTLFNVANYKCDIIGGKKNEDNTEQTIEIDEKDLKKVLEAAQSCPVTVIHIINKDTGEKLI
jgi:ferredoxin